MKKIARFLKEVKAELSKVIWPTREQAIKLTILVLAGVVLIGLFIGGVDFIFSKIIQFLLKS